MQLTLGRHLHSDARCDVWNLTQYSSRMGQADRTESVVLFGHYRVKEFLCNHGEHHILEDTLAFRFFGIDGHGLDQVPRPPIKAG